MRLTSQHHHGGRLINFLLAFTLAAANLFNSGLPVVRAQDLPTETASPTLQATPTAATATAEPPTATLEPTAAPTETATIEIVPSATLETTPTPDLTGTSTSTATTTITTTATLETPASADGMTYHQQPPADVNALVLVSGGAGSLNKLVAAIRALGGDAPILFSPYALLANLDSSHDDALRAQPGVSAIYRSPLTPEEISALPADYQPAANTWSSMWKAPDQPMSVTTPQSIPGGDAFMPPDSNLARPSGGPGPNANQTSLYMLGTVKVNVFLPESNGAIDANSENWTTTQINLVQSEITSGLAWWSATATNGGRPSAHLNFDISFHTPVNEPGVVATGYEPINHPESEEGLWINSIMTNLGYGGYDSYFTATRAYDNAQRNAAGTDWAISIFVANSFNDSDNKFPDGYFAYAYYHGPFMVMTYENDGWGIDAMEMVTAHELAHSFGAGDEYWGSGCSTSNSFGYLVVPHTNCEDSGGNAAEDSIMRSSGNQWVAYPAHSASNSVRGEIGWRDTNGNGWYDPIDTLTNTLTAYSPDPTGAATLTYTHQHANDVPWSPGTYSWSSNNGSYTPVSINFIAGGNYGVDGTTISYVTPEDGLWGSQEEYYSFSANVSSGATHVISSFLINKWMGQVATATDSVTILGPATVGTYDDASNYLGYSGGWVTTPFAGGYASTLHYTTTNGSSASMTFTGAQSVSVVYTGNSNRGSMRVQIDGSTVDTFSQYAAGMLYQQSRSYAVTTGTHTLTLTSINNGSDYVDLDAIILGGPIPPTSTPTRTVTATATRTGTATATLRPPVGLGVYDDSNANLVYSGAWASTTFAGAYASTLHYTNAFGASASLTFSGGESVTITYTGYSNRGSMQVQIDGVTVGTFSQYSANWAYQQTRTYSVTTGTHTVTVSNASSDGSYVDVDAITVAGPPPPTSTPTQTRTATATITPKPPVGLGVYDDTNPAVVYSGTWFATSGSSFYASTLHYSNYSGASASLTFSGGESFTITYTGHPNRGLMRVVLDGSVLDTFSQNAASMVYQQTKTYAVSTGTHTLVVSNSDPGGAYVDVDAITVAGPPPPTSTPTQTATVTQTRTSTTTLTPKPPVGVGVYDDTNPAVVFSSGWTSVYSSGFYASTLHYSNIYGSSASLTFSGGESVTITYTGHPNRGLMQVVLDGAVIDTFTQNTASMVFQQTRTYAVSTATHTLVLSNADPGGAYVDVDAVTVAGPPPPTSTPTQTRTSTVTLTPKPPVGVGVYDDTNANIVFGGAWATTTFAPAYAATLHYTNAFGAAASLTFSGGETVTITYTGYLNRGNMRVQIDGATVDTFSQYAPGWAYQQTRTYSVTTGTHTLTVSNASSDGSYIDVDAITISGPIPPTATPTPTTLPSGETFVDDTDPGITYQGDWNGWMRTEDFGGSHMASHTFSPAQFCPDYVQYTFFGSQIGLLYNSGPGGDRIMNILIDGSFYASLNQYSDTNQFQRRWMSGSLTLASHTILLDVPNCADVVTLDAFIVASPAPATSTPTATATQTLRPPVGLGTYDDAHPNVIYGGAWETTTGASFYASTLHYTNTAGASASLTFSGADTVSVIYTGYTNRGSMQVQIDGTTVETFSQYAPTMQFQLSKTYPVSTATHVLTLTNVSSGGLYMDVDAIRVAGPLPPTSTPTRTVTATQTRTSTVTQTPKPPVGVGVYDDPHASLVYSSGWLTTSGASFYGSTLHYTSTAGASVSLTFTGANSVSVVYTGYSNRGSMQVQIDGTTVETFSQYAGSMLYQQTKTYPVSTATHTITLVNVSSGGQYVDMDAVSVAGPPPPTATPTQTYTSTPTRTSTVTATPRTPMGLGTYDDAHPSVIYGGAWETIGGASFYASSLHYTASQGSTAALTFTGAESYTIIYTGNSNRGLLEVRLDGVPVDTINQNAGTIQYQQTRTYPATTATHTLTLTNVSTGGQYVDLDAITIAGPVCYRLKLDANPYGSYNANPTNSPGCASSYYSPGTSVTVSASPISGYLFAGWIGDASGTDNPLTVVVDRSKIISAIYGEIVTSGIVDDPDNRIIYLNGWTTTPGSSFYNSTLHYTNISGASASLAFSGDSITVIYTKYNNRGNMQVKIDGTIVDTFSQYAADFVYQQSKTYSVTAGNHLLTLSNASTGGQYVDVDAISLTAPSVVANDDFNNATNVNLTNNQFTAQMDTTNATTAVDDPSFMCNSGQHYNSVWYRFTAPSAGTLTNINTTGSAYDTLMAVWSGARGSLTSLGCDDDGGGGTSSLLTNLAVTAGQSVYIEVSGYYNYSYGDLRLSVTFEPTGSNDDFNNATVVNLSNNQFAAQQDTTNATTAADDPSFTCVSGQHYNTVWYKFTAPSAGTLTNINTNGSAYDTLMAVWSGNRGSLTSLGCSDDEGDGNNSLLTNLAVTAGQIVYIEVAGYSSTSYGDLRLSITFSNVTLTTDTDGDGLPDLWETNGYDPDHDGTIEVDLPALGANPLHKDIFVEMDYMVKPGIGDLGPDASMMNDIVAVFNNAPVSNPDSTTGIHIHLQKDQEVPYDADLNPIWSEFNALKATYFNTDRTATHHYMIWVNGYNGADSSGVSSGIGATDFIVSLGLWNSGAGGTHYERVGTFIHELGHNLNLTHGGVDGENFKPNYLSIMNYFFQTTGLYRDGHWGNAGYPLNFDYQRLDVVSLPENALYEGNGLTGGGDVSSYGTTYFCPNAANDWDRMSTTNALRVDWNCDGDTNDSAIQLDINRSGTRSTLTSQNNWPNISFSGGGIIGSGAAPATLQQLIPDSPPVMEELTWEMQQKLNQSLRK